ncbi:MAG TPA: alpha-amylase family glycosyl hydrolase, partial [Ruminiclostridium sp.]|nr:alpha-amylase family glycosyl hydrolase [Ruminiclostridium sp.]
LSWLKKLISACHEQDIHVIMDGVYNHVSMDFPYKQFYLNQEECPYTGTYGGTFTGLQDLNFNNACTNDFILDVCTYWSEVFGIDGIRFDNTINFYKARDHKGLSKLIPALNKQFAKLKQENFSLTLEHIDVDAAQVTNEVDATSFWDNALYERTFQYLYAQQIDSRLLNALTDQRYLDSTAKVPTIYLSNHDHSQVAWQAGARENLGRMRWYKAQPYVIALYTSPATPLIANGAEFAEDYWLPEDDHGTGTRVSPRPLRWIHATDDIGIQMAALYRRMGQIRQNYPGLQSPNFEPMPWEEWQMQFNPQGYGIDVGKQLVIYHRWGNDMQGKSQKFVVVINFADYTQQVRVPFPENGLWTDLLCDYQGTWQVQVNAGWLAFEIGSNWGHIFYK